jgi:toxin HigB-1
MLYSLDTKVQVSVSKLAAKQLKKLPQFIVDKLAEWAFLVEGEGLMIARLRPGYHDEPLQGKRQHQRSIRLSRQWRAIYEVSELQTLILVDIMEVTAHDYRTREHAMARRT